MARPSEAGWYVVAPTVLMDYLDAVHEVEVCSALADRVRSDLAATESERAAADAALEAARSLADALERALAQERAVHDAYRAGAVEALRLAERERRRAEVRGWLRTAVGVAAGFAAGVVYVTVSG